MNHQQLEKEKVMKKRILNLQIKCAVTTLDFFFFFFKEKQGCGVAEEWNYIDRLTFL